MKDQDEDMIPDDGVLRCQSCGEPLEDNMYTDDPDEPCMNCMQQRADLLHDQMKEFNLIKHS